MKMTLVAFGTALLLSSCTGAVQNTPPASTGNAHAIAPPGAASYAVIHSFTGGSDGGNAETPLTFDAAGNAYGTTVQGGTYGYGTVFRLHPKSGGQWQETVLYSFTGFGDGKNPHGGVVLDSHGNLYGTTTAGGSSTCTGDGCGVIFEVPHGGGGESVLYSFQGGNDGFGPGSPLAFDSSGNLYGMTPDGGKFGNGTIFVLESAGSSWHFRTIHAFTGGRDGSTGSLGALLVDAQGALYGVTEVGGLHSAGTAFRLTHSGSNWKFTTIYAFKGAPDGANPYGGLVQSGGKLYGTTYYGGSGNLGTVFELTAPGAERVVYNFKGGKDGSLSTSSLVAQAGVLYGTTSGGGSSCGCGTVFSLAIATSKETVLHSFGAGTDGQYPYFGLTQFGTSLYSSTVLGGSSGNGTIFSLSP